MNWLDIILDHISQYGIKNITLLEKQYLENYQTNLEEDIECDLNQRFNFYKSMYYYNINDNTWSSEDMMVITEDEIKQTRLNLLWDHIELEDVGSFMKIYKVPNKFFNLHWTELPQLVRDKFENYWENYYNFETI